MAFKEIAIETMSMNPFTKIANEWALLTAGTKDKGFNMMTVSWAGFGHFWEKNAVSVYVRESRYTRKFVIENDLFTVSFLDKANREALNVCGKLHGNECDKVRKSGLTPYFTDGTASFEQANLIFVCKKMIHADLTKENTDDMDTFNDVYPTPDYHRMYIGEVVKVLQRV